MEIAIYQVNMGRDHNRVAFQSIDELERFQGSSEIESEIYDKVFEGEVSCENLEDVLLPSLSFALSPFLREPCLRTSILMRRTASSSSMN